MARSGTRGSPALAALTGAPLADLVARGRWVVAYSGGLDSTVLLHLLAARLAGLSGAPELLAVHVNHGLSPRADAWQAHCEAVCAGWGLPIRSVIVALPRRPGAGLEAAARRARYAALEAQLGPGDPLFLGHHRDDQLETLLLRLLRHSGVAGLAGMAARSRHPGGLRVRPLLPAPRSELLAYARGHGLRWIEDESNAEHRFSRNFVRHRLLPAMAEHWPDTPQRLLALSRSAADAAALLAEVAAEDLAAAAGDDRWGHFLQLGPLRSWSAPRRRNALTAWLHRLGQPALGERQWLALEGRLAGAGGQRALRVDLSGGGLRDFRGRLYWVPQGPSPQRVEWDLQRPLTLPGAGRLRALPGVAGGLAAARYALGFRRGGEQLQLPGSGGPRPLGEYLRSLGMPPWWRDRVPLLFRGEHLAAVADFCVCAGFEAPAGRGWQVCWEPSPGAGSGGVAVERPGPFC